MVIYKDLYDVIKELEFFKEYRFEEIKDKNYISSNTNLVYSVHSSSVQLTKKKEEEEEEDIKQNQFHNKEYSKYDKRRINILSNNQVQRKNNNSKKQNKLIDNSLFKILLIDDDEDILFTFTSIIEGEGYKTKSISNPVQALNYFSQIDPYYYDLIVMDVRMPGMNGIQLYSKIKIMNPDIKVLFLSALDAVEELLSIFPEVKPSEIIRKPIESKELVLKINTILRS